MAFKTSLSVDKITELGDSFINAALDSLEGEAGSYDKHAAGKVLSVHKLAQVREAVAFWGEFELETKREDWRDAALQISQMQEAGEGSKKELAEKVRAAKGSGASETEKKRLLSALMNEVKSLTTRNRFAETAYLSMVNDWDEAPDPGAPLSAAAEAAEFVAQVGSESGGLQRALDAARADLAAATASATSGLDSAAATELKILKDTTRQRVETEVRRQLATADKRAVELEVAADSATAARIKSDEALADMRKAYDAAQSQLFEVEEAREQGRQAASGENDVLAWEAEQLHLRESTSRSEVQRLQLEVSRLQQRLAADGG
eukprot:CAMPEP_0181382508 /NCGR_PEP_ID=MMETSP1106-20121128/20783_1 /TAXON_ID=81844 /ORGANISM="Mantoniella antarctica, Strain SL-175" /LENGTH=319 /DNA_ID=CAMNT_0023501945 /DNA_START=88 /DNA_END=1043 /DNA_ORIENTATION=-